MMSDQKAKVPLGSKSLSEPDLGDLDDTHRSVLNIIAENSPCTEPKLFITAINSGQACFSGISLGDLRERLGQYVQELEAAGLVEMVENEFVLADTSGAENDDDLDQTVGNEHEASAGQGHLDDEPSSGPQPAFATETKAPGAAAEPLEEGSDALPPEGVEDGDVLDLTGELELELVADVAEEAPIDQSHADDNPLSGAGRGHETEAEGIAGAPEAPTDDIDPIDLRSPESTEDQDILDLTGELELEIVPDERELVSDEPEKASADRQDNAREEPPAGPSEKDGTEPDGEPTREEIVDAMRRFVSEDEPDNKQGQ